MKISGNGLKYKEKDEIQYDLHFPFCFYIPKNTKINLNPRDLWTPMFIAAFISIIWNSKLSKCPLTSIFDKYIYSKLLFS